MAKEKSITVNLISNGITTSTVIQRQIFNKAISIDGKWHDVKNNKEGFYIEIIDDIPEWQTFKNEPIETLDPEFHRSLSWYCDNRKDILNTLDLRYIMIDCNEGNLYCIPIEKREQRVC